MADLADDPRNRLGSSLRERQRPLRARRQPTLAATDGLGAIGRRGSLGRLGDLGRATRTFASAAGLSLSSRQALGGDAPGAEVWSMPVAPPAEWGDAVAAGAVAPTGDAVLDRLIAHSHASRPAASGPRRGLLSTVRRQSTAAGPDTGPAAAARRLRSVATPAAQDPEIRQALGGASSAPPDRGYPRPGGPGGARPPAGPRPGTAPAASAPRPGDRSPRGGWSASAIDPRRPGGATATPGPVAGPSSQAASPASGRSPHATGLSTRPAGPTPRGPIDLRSATVGQGAAAAAQRLATTLGPVLARPDGAGARDVAPERSREPASATSASTTTGSAPTAQATPAPGTTAQATTAQTTTDQAPTDQAPTGLLRAAGPLPPGLGPPTRRTAGSASQPGATPARLPAAVVTGSPTTGSASQPSITAPALGAAIAASSTPTPFGVPLAATSGPIGPASAGSRPAISPTSAVPARPDGAGTRQLAPERAGAPSPRLLASLARDATSGVTLTSLPAGGPGARRSHPGGLRSALPTSAGSVTSTAAAPGAVHASAVSAASATGPTPARSNAPGSSPASPNRARPTATSAASASDRTAPASPGVGAVASALLAASGRSGAPSTTPTGPGRSFGGPVAPGASRVVRSLPDLGAVAAPTAPSGGPRGAGSVPATAAGRAPVSSTSAYATPTAASSPAVGPNQAGSVPAPAATAAAPSAPRSAASAGLPVAPAASSPTPAASTAPLPDIADPAERFQRELERDASRPAPARLPHRFEPMARALLPATARPRISTGEASRRALASVGKVAATTGDTIHLARPLDATPRSSEIVAHELTHVASPSPAPRFFDDDRDSPEERRARANGRTMSQSPVGSPPAAPNSTQSSSTPASPSSTAPTTANHVNSAQPNQPPAPSSTGTPIVVPPPATTSHDDSGNDTDPIAAASIDVERLLDALEARVLRELERRGRRWPRMI